jgi:DNA-binding SARP family transcriptional activator/predicted ATPase
MDKLQINLLGKPEVLLNGQPLAGFETAKSQAVLYYLAVSGRLHSREALASLLWGEMPEALAKRNLTKALTNLRRLLGPFLLIERQEVGFHPEKPIELDVTFFEAALADGSGDEEGRIERLKAAAELYRGDFLEGFFVKDELSFEEWALNQRERLREAMLLALDRLVAHSLERGEYEAGIELGARLLRLDPWREPAHRQMMLLYARSGQRSAALALYETCRQVLAAELGVEPMPETTALYEQIKAGGRSPPHNLPPALTSFVGREMELGQLARQLSDPECRLLTLVGPGGIGKSRLAIQGARRYIRPDHPLGEPNFRDGVFFIDLSAVGLGETAGEEQAVGLRGKERIVYAIAEDLYLSLQGPVGLLAQLANYLHKKEMLLVLDNFEQLIEEARLLVDLLQRAPGIKLLITSRERLNLREEWVLEVHGLEYPAAGAGPAEILQRYSAVQLFVNSAQRVRAGLQFSEADFAQIARICRLVEGAPLALELASSWVKALTCADIAAEIERSLDFLTTSLRNVPERHRSLRAVFEQSWEMLSPGEKEVFRKLTVFRGGFRREAAQVVVGATLPVLAGLVDKSLLRLGSTGRYQVHELLRQYAAEKLGENWQEREAVLDAYCRCYLRFLSFQEQRLEGDDQLSVLAELGEEVDNLNAAWEWAILPGRVDLAVELGGAVRSLRILYSFQGWYQEGYSLCTCAIHRFESEMNSWPAGLKEGLSWAYAQVLLQKALFCQYLSRFEEAEALCHKSISVIRSLDDAALLSNALLRLGFLGWVQGQPEAAEEYLRAALAVLEGRPDPVGAARAEMVLGLVAYQLKQYPEAEQRLRGSLEALKAAGERRYRRFGLGYLAGALYALGKAEEARPLFLESVGVALKWGAARGFPHRHYHLRYLLYHLRDFTSLMDCDLWGEIQELLEESVVVCRDSGDTWAMALSLTQLGYAAHILGEPEAAWEHFSSALEAARQLPTQDMLLEALVGLAVLRAKAGQGSPEEQERGRLALLFVLAHPQAERPTKDRASAFLSMLEGSGSSREKTAPDRERLARERLTALTLEEAIDLVRGAAMRGASMRGASMRGASVREAAQPTGVAAGE